MGGLCIRPGSPASSPQVDAAEPASEQSCSRGAACCGPAASPAASARTPQDSYVDQCDLGAADHQEYHGESMEQRLCIVNTRRDSWARHEVAQGSCTLTKLLESSPVVISQGFSCSLVT